MFDGAGDDTIGTADRMAGEGDATQCCVCPLCATAGKDDLVSFGSDQGGDSAAGSRERDIGAAPRGVDAGGIAEIFRKIGLHGCQHFGQHGCSGCVIEINHNALYFYQKFESCLHFV